MPSLKYKITIISISGFLLVFSLFLPEFCFAQETPVQAPGTLEEAKSFIFEILGGLPGAVKKVWQEQALPLWKNMWEWAKSIIEPWWHKFLGFLGKEVDKRKPGIEERFQEEKEEIKEDIWSRFKDLLR